MKCTASVEMPRSRQNGAVEIFVHGLQRFARFLFLGRKVEGSGAARFRHEGMGLKPSFNARRKRDTIEVLPRA